MRRAALLAPLLAAMIGAAVSAPFASPGPLASPGAPVKTPPVAPGAAAKGETDVSSSDGPLQIFSDDNLEWTKVSKDEDLIVARGNAKAIRGNMVVTADVLLAHTRPKAPLANQPTSDSAKQSDKDSGKDASDPSGGKEIWRVEAQGHVIIASPVESPTKRAYGDYADYNVDQKVVVLTGKDLRIVTPTDIITARDSLEYWQATDQAVGRGNAVAVRPEKQERIQADVLQAEFVDNDKKQKDLQVAHGFGHVVMTTPTEVVTGDRSDYFVDTGIVTLTGMVKLTKGDNLTEGCYAVVNQKTGISRVYPAPPGKPIPDKGCQVRALLVSQKGTKTDGTKTDTSKPAAGTAAAPHRQQTDRQHAMMTKPLPSQNPEAWPIGPNSPLSTSPAPPGADGRTADPVPTEHEEGLFAVNIGKQFKRRPVLRGVSVRVRRGEAVGLLGPNGAGKTTCFYCITGLINPDSGTIRLDGQDITDLPMYRRARLGIGYLPQEASIFRGLSVENNIRAILEVTEPDREKREVVIEDLLAEFSITHLRRAPALALSGGERRRVEIARALASNPAFILLDEPLAGIDPIAVSDIRDLVAHLKHRGIGVLITDHNVRETLDIIDRAYILHDGAVLMEGEPAEVVAHEGVRRVYLGENFSL